MFVTSEVPLYDSQSQLMTLICADFISKVFIMIQVVPFVLGSGLGQRALRFRGWGIMP